MSPEPSAKTRKRRTRKCNENTHEITGDGKCRKKCPEGKVRSEKTFGCRTVKVRKERARRSPSASGTRSRKRKCNENTHEITGDGKCRKKCPEGKVRSEKTFGCRTVKVRKERARRRKTPDSFIDDTDYGEVWDSKAERQHQENLERLKQPLMMAPAGNNLMTVAECLKKASDLQIRDEYRRRNGSKKSKSKSKISPKKNTPPRNAVIETIVATGKNAGKRRIALLPLQ